MEQYSNVCILLTIILEKHNIDSYNKKIKFKIS
jgi:hypothetical protein